MEKKISGQYFYVNMCVFISDDCNVALTYQEQLFTHASAQETPSDKKCEPFSLSAQSSDFYTATGPVGFHPSLSLLPVAAFRVYPQWSQHCFIFSCEDGAWCPQAMTAMWWWTLHRFSQGQWGTDTSTAQDVRMGLLLGSVGWACSCKGWSLPA